MADRSGQTLKLRPVHTKWSCPCKEECLNREEPWRFFHAYMPANTSTRPKPTVYLPMTLVPRCRACSSMMTIFDYKSEIYLDDLFPRLFPTKCTVRIIRSFPSGELRCRRNRQSQSAGGGRVVVPDGEEPQQVAVKRARVAFSSGRHDPFGGN